MEPVSLIRIIDPLDDSLDLSGRSRLTSDQIINGRHRRRCGHLSVKEIPPPVWVGGPFEGIKATPNPYRQGRQRFALFVCFPPGRDMCYGRRVAGQEIDDFVNLQEEDVISEPAQFASAKEPDADQAHEAGEF